VKGVFLLTQEGENLTMVNKKTLFSHLPIKKVEEFGENSPPS